jgi:uncharacterized repeat protein (TIGR01451 family)
MPEAPRRAAPGRLIRTAVLRRLILAGAVGSLLLAIPPATSAAGSVSLTTPYPAVAVPPGEKVSFKINVRTDVSDRVDLSVAQVPEGWIASLRGEGFVVDGVQTTGNDPVELTLDVTVPEDAAAGTGRVVVNARSGAARDSLTLDIRVEEGAAGEVALSSDFPVIEGAAGASFSWSVRLTNDTAEDLTFSLSATGPAGWDVQARPTGQAQAASANVTAGGNTTINVTTTAPDGIEAGDYPINVQAVGPDSTAEIELTAKVVGSFDLEVTTQSGVLNTSGNAGSTIDQTIVVQNTGSAPLENVQLSGTAPSGWTITFDPPALNVPSGAEQNTATSVAHIVPSGDAIAGDYQVKVRAQNDLANGEADLRVTVETSLLWGIIGLGLIVLVVIGLAYVFRRYGRR